MSRVAIVALGPSAHSYMRLAENVGDRRLLFDEVWSINGFGQVFTIDRAFAMDDVRVQAIRAKAGNHKMNNTLSWLRDAPGPVYTSRPLPTEANLERIEELKKIIPILPRVMSTEGPASEYEIRAAELETLEIERDLIDTGGFKGLVPFPLADVINKFRVHPHFNNTVAYAIALAAYEGHNMAIFGADFSYPNAPYIVEQGRGCCEFWIGLAHGLGLSVDVARASTLMGAVEGVPLYGYDGYDVEGNLDANGNVIFNLKDRPLPSAAQIERAYDKDARKKAA